MVWASGAVLALSGLSFFGSAALTGIFVGALIASLNLEILSRSVRSMVEGRRGGWAGIAVLKFVGLLAVTYVLIDRGYVEPLFLAVGFSALPSGILLSGTLAPSFPDTPSPSDSLPSVPSTSE